MTIVLLYIGVFLLGLGASFANSTKTDSLLKVLQTTTHDTSRINVLNTLAWQFKYNNPDTAILLSTQALELSEELMRGISGHSISLPLGRARVGLSQSHNNLGVFNYLKGNYPIALDHYNKALKIDSQLNEKEGIASAFGNIGIIYRKQGDYPKALEYYFKALKMSEELGIKRYIAAFLGNIGIVYEAQGDYPEALEYYFKALKMKEEIGNKSGMANTLGNIGAVYHRQGDHPKALEYYFKALEIDEELEIKNGIAIHLGNIGIVYYEQGDYPKALKYYFKALKMDEELGRKSGIAAAFGNIGSLYTEQKKYHKAERYLLQALEIDTAIGRISGMMYRHKALSELYEQTRQYQKAYEHYKAYSIAKDTIYNEEKSKDIGRLEAGFEYDKKLALEQAEHEKKSAVAASESKRQRVVIYAVSGGMLLLVVFFILLFNRFRIIRRQKNIIEKQKQVVDEKNVEISQKNKDITDSIHYAQNIQKAILPPIEEIKKGLPDSFVLFKPKDIVSGDFYFYANVKTGQTGTVVLAACDCTGHGVPGAFMSMIGNSLLNEIVNDKSVTDAAEVLNQLRGGVIHAFGEAGATGEQKDGMDMALCVFKRDKDNGIVNLQFAGAYNPLYIVRSTNKSPLKGGSSDLSGQGGVDTSGTNTPKEKSAFSKQPAVDIPRPFETSPSEEGGLTVIKADKQPVGFYPGEQKPFTNHEVQLQKGDTVYIFSDGYQDQFGGLRGKKFMSKRFRQLLLDIQEKSMEEQKEHLDKTIEEWKGDGEQVDDILVIGVKV